MLLAEEVRVVFPRFQRHHLVVVHDAAMSRVPWEPMALPNGNPKKPWLPAAEKGLSHRYAADNLSVAKWLEERVEDGVLNVLVVINPTKDLPGAAEEGERVLELLKERPSCRVDVLREQEATRPALLAAFGSGKYDVIHYAGHAFFDERSPEQSGVLCHGRVPLTGADVASLGKLPTLVFFNACESARVRQAPAARRKQERKKERLKQVDASVGLAEAFMRGGVATFIGTYWPVGDAPAKTFAEEFYTKVMLGTTLGEAIQAARQAVSKQGSKDWADYIFYGNSDFVLKEALG
jgi:CHAT domain-containing protein